MTKEEAYNTMQEGIPVSHKDFREDEFLWMDENYIIRDENGDEFESSWDVKKGDRWETDWYIYKKKTKVIKRKAIPFKNSEESYITSKQLISHIQGTQCQGKDSCLQYNMAGETACVMCDCKEDERYIESNTDLYSESVKLLETTYTNVESEIIKEETLKRKVSVDAYKKPSLFTRIKNLFRRKSNE